MVKSRLFPSACGVVHVLSKTAHAVRVLSRRSEAVLAGMVVADSLSLSTYTLASPPQPVPSQW